MDFNISDISRKTGFPKTRIKEILDGRVKYPKETIIKSIAEVVGLAPEELIQNLQERTIKKSHCYPSKITNDSIYECL